jgi:DnaJ-class molecular chaperone
MSQTFYDILGVPKGTTDANVLKKAYKKQAMRWHPDKCKDPKDEEKYKQKFQRIGEAYTVLSDEKKRQIYDIYGEEGLKGGVPENAGAEGFPGGGMPGGFSFRTAGNGGPGAYTFSSGDADDLFSQIFGNLGGKRGGMGGMGGMRFGNMAGPGGFGGARAGARGSPFDGMHFAYPDGDSDSGADSGFESMYGRSRSQSPPPQKRAAPPAVEHPLNCTLEELYHGKTKMMRITRTVDNPNTGASTQEKKEYAIELKPHWKEGTKIRYTGAGDARIGQAPQDVVFIVKEKPHATFKREGDNLLQTVTISLKDALTGNTTVKVPTMDGKGVDVRLRGVTSPGATRTLAGYGMPRKAGGRGDMVVTFNVKFPDTLSPMQASTIASVL